MSPVTTPTPLLLITDSAETCERIASALLSAPAYYRVERITSAELAQKGPPKESMLALVDQNLRSVRPAQVVQELTAAGLVAVALIDSRDVQLLQDVVLAGASALVATPFADSQLWETVAAALARGGRPAAPPNDAGWRPGRPRSHGLIIALYGPKNGSGTSVIAANLAIAMQERGGRGTALIEISEGASSQGIILNLRAERTLADLLARYEPGDTDLLSGVLTSHSSGLRVLLSPATAGVRIPASFLDDLIDTLQQMFDFVIVDLHSTVVSNSIAVLHKANAPLLVIVPEMTSLHQGQIFLQTMESSAPEVRLNILLNRSTLAAGVPPEAIRRHLKMQIAAEIPDDQALVTDSINRGIPLITDQPRSAVARAMQKLARELAPVESNSPSGSLVERLAKVAPMGPLARLATKGGRA